MIVHKNVSPDLSRHLVVVILVALTFVAGYWGGKRSVQASPPNYIFDSKTFSDFKNGSFESIYVAGTLTGDGVGYENNTTAVTCSKDTMECLVNSIQGISKTSCQLGRLSSPQAF